MINKQSDYLNKKDIIFLILFGLFLISIVYLSDFYKKHQLRSYKKTKGIITSKYKGGYRTRFYINVKYKIEGKYYENDGTSGFQINDCIDRLNVGDTVLIKYSITNPETVSIIDCEHEQ